MQPRWHYLVPGLAALLLLRHRRRRRCSCLAPAVTLSKHAPASQLPFCLHRQRDYGPHHEHRPCIHHAALLWCWQHQQVVCCERRQRQRAARHAGRGRQGAWCERRLGGPDQRPCLCWAGQQRKQPVSQPRCQAVGARRPPPPRSLEHRQAVEQAAECQLRLGRLRQQAAQPAAPQQGQRRQRRQRPAGPGDAQAGVHRADRCEEGARAGGEGSCRRVRGSPCRWLSAIARRAPSPPVPLAPHRCRASRCRRTARRAGAQGCRARARKC